MKINNLYKFFDYFGIAAFLFLPVDSLYYIYSGELNWRIILRLLIGLSGFVVDGYLVFFYKDKKIRACSSAG
jgi:uncharacterized membrane protein